MANKTPLLTGSCACGSISYTSTSLPTHLDYCYCLTCQKISGAPFQAWTGIPKPSLTWTFKTPPIIWRAPAGNAADNVYISERTCCAVCGCNVILQYYLYPEKTHVAAVTVERWGGGGDGWPAVGCHIWTKHVPRWHSIAEDGVGRYEEFDEVFRARMEGYLKNKKDEEG